MKSNRVSVRVRVGHLVWALLALVGWQTATARDAIEITTPQFVVISSLNEKDTRELIDEMRIFQAVVSSFTTVKDLRPQVPLRIYLINSADWEKFFQFRKNVAGYMSSRALGFDAALNAQNWVGATRLLFHEYVHFMLRNADSSAYPQWFDEGLAEVLSTVKIVKGKVHVGEPVVERLRSLEDVGGARWVPLRQMLESMPRPENNDDEAGHSNVFGFYAQSWALVHYLSFERPGGTKQMRQYLASRQQGVSLEAAFEQSFDMSIADMEAVLKNYVKPRAYKIVTADPDKLALPPLELKVRQLNATESALEFGQLLVRTGVKRENPTAYFDRILKTEPRNAAAMAGKANVLAQYNQTEAADAALKQALEWAPTDRAVLLGAANTYFRRSLPTAGGDVQTRTQAARTAFDYYQKCVTAESAVAGDFTPEVGQRYANLAMQVGASLDRPLIEIVRLREKYPTSPNLALTQAQLLTAMQRQYEARQAWEVVARYGRGAMQEAALKTLAK